MITRLCNHMRNEKRYISIPARPMATKLNRKVAYDEKMLSTKSYNPLITWTHQVAWQIKNVILYLQFHETCSNKTKQDGGLWYEVANLRVKWYHVTNKKTFYFYFSKVIPIKIEMVMVYEMSLPSTMTTWNNGWATNKKVMSLFLYDSWLTNWFMVLWCSWSGD